MRDRAKFAPFPMPPQKETADAIIMSNPVAIVPRKKRQNMTKGLERMYVYQGLNGIVDDEITAPPDFNVEAEAMIFMQREELIDGICGVALTGCSGEAANDRSKSGLSSSMVNVSASTHVTIDHHCSWAATQDLRTNTVSPYTPMIMDYPMPNMTKADRLKRFNQNLFLRACSSQTNMPDGVVYPQPRSVHDPMIDPVMTMFRLSEDLTEINKTYHNTSTTLPFEKGIRLPRFADCIMQLTMVDAPWVTIFRHLAIELERLLMDYLQHGYVTREQLEEARATVRISASRDADGNKPKPLVVNLLLESLDIPMRENERIQWQHTGEDKYEIPSAYRYLDRLRGSGIRNNAQKSAITQTVVDMISNYVELLAKMKMKYHRESHAPIPSIKIVQCIPNSGDIVVPENISKKNLMLGLQKFVQSAKKFAQYYKPHFVTTNVSLPGQEMDVLVGVHDV